MEEKRIIESLLFYVEMLPNKKKTEELQKELENMGISYDYFYQTIDKAKELLNK